MHINENGLPSSELSWFSDIKLPLPIEVFDLHIRYYKDKFESKLNLAIGAYRTNDGYPWILPVVKIAENRIVNDEALNKENLPVLGLETFCNAATNMLLGEDSSAIVQNRTFGVQALSGAGALRIGAEFLNKTLGRKIFYYSDPTWGNHLLIFKNAGFEEGRAYRYWSEHNRSIDFEGMLEDLRNAPEGSVVILQTCAHNPTGTDPTPDQWEKIAELMQEKKLFPFFDSALQGFATGDLDKDAFSVRLFVEKGLELFCAQSFSKNMGLYNERIGNLVVVLNDIELVERVRSQITLIIRGMYSNPQSHGAQIVSCILNDSELYNQWKGNLKTMFSRLRDMRRQLREALENLGTPCDWSHLTQQTGMSCCTGLNRDQANHMVNKHHIYMLSSGRINIAAITPSNVDQVAQAINETINQSFVTREI